MNASASPVLTCSCAYLNTFYNARQSYDEGVRLAAGSDSLPAAAAEAFRLAAEKSAIVLDRYPDSDYVDDALILMAESFYRLGSWGDAAASYRSAAFTDWREGMMVARTSSRLAVANVQDGDGVRGGGQRPKLRER